MALSKTIRRSGRRIFNDLALGGGFDALAASWNPEFDYQFRGADANAGLVNDGSEDSSANDFVVQFSQAPDLFQQTNGDVVNPGFCTHHTDADGYGPPVQLYVPGTEWDMTSGSIVAIFRSDVDSPNREALFAMAAQSGFGIALFVDAAGHLEFFCKLTSNSGGELNIDSGGNQTVISNDDTWHIVVITQDGGAANNPLMYLDGVIEDSSGGSFDSNDDREYWFKTILDSIPSVRTAFGAIVGGADPGTSLTQGFDGNIDRIIFMTKELSASEVLSMYNIYFGL